MAHASRPPSGPSLDPQLQSRRVVKALERAYPEVSCALRHRNPFELLAATILSAQCTDARVNLVTPALFARYPDARALSEADPDMLEGLIRSTGFFRAKARSLLGMAPGSSSGTAARSPAISTP